LEPGHMTLLLGAQATKQNIVDTIRQVCARAPKNSTLYIYYSGQGEVKGMWPVDYQDCDICYLSYDELINGIIMRANKFKNVLLVIDANYTGVGLNAVKKTKDETRDQQAEFWKRKTGEKVMVFTTSPEYSLIKEKNAPSVLIPMLKSIKADRNNDSIITADELGNYLRSAEQEKKASVFFGTGGFPISFLKRNLPIVRPVATPRAPKEPAPETAGQEPLKVPESAPAPAKPPVTEKPQVIEKPQAEMAFAAVEPVMVKVEGGLFTMGHNPGDADERPYHNVIVKDFYIGKFEVTVAEYRKFIRASHYITSAQKNGWGFVRNGDWEKKEGVNWDFDEYGVMKTTDNEDSVPVRYVSWNDANKYCEWLSKTTNQHYRLPTEAEWEYAAQGGKANNGHLNLYSGSDNLNEVGWYHENSGSVVHAKGLKKPNELGLYDMSGNVSEWCSDYYDATYYTELEDKETMDPKGPASGEQRVLRGGFFVSDSNSNRISSRDHNSPGICYGLYGFRVVRD
ncbi:MAG: SUMF1/EgtB/PvdO family nonheme iron enzyme, partial [Taibaiella sp.]|nr:SUMF1/EgtB/PvdO family nonheme iron enzyme [Taibaiella sp.]